MGYGGKGYGYTQAGYGYGTSEFTGFDGLSIIPDTLGWWSVARRVLNRYNGPVIRLRRSSDSAERDFYGIGPQGEVSTSDVRAFNGWNLLARTEEFDESFWSKLNATVSAATPPAGYTEAWKIEETAVTGVHYVGRNMSDVITGGTQHTISVVAKAAERSVVSLVGESNGDFRCDFNLANGTLQNIGVGASGAIQSLGDGWYRCSLTFTPADTSGVTYIATLQAVAGALSHAGTLGHGVLITGSQLERASSFSTYEPRGATPAGSSFLVTLYDQSGLARHFTQSTTTLQPIICEQGVPVTENGRLAAKFVAADARRMSIASSTGMFNALHTTGGTVLCVSKANDTAAAKLILSSASSSTGAGFRMSTGSNEVIQYSTGRLDVAGVATAGNSIVLSGANSQASSLRINAAVLDPDNGTAASRVSYWENGTQGVSTNAQTGTPFVENAADNMTLGATSAGGSPHDGPISELALFSAAISTADRTAWQSRSGIFYTVAIS